MKKILIFFSKAPIFWQILFFMIGTVNLSIPLVLNQISDNRVIMAEISEGLNRIQTDMVVINGKLTAEEEVVNPHSKNVVSVMHTSQGDLNHVSFQRKHIEIRINDYTNKIEYEESMDKSQIITSIEKQIIACMIAISISSVLIAVLISILVFLILLLLSHYLIKSGEKHRVLFRLLNPPYFIGGYISIILAQITNKYTLVYLISVVIIGLLFAYILKNQFQRSTNDFYFGKGENFNELY